MLNMYPHDIKQGNLAFCFSKTSVMSNLIQNIGKTGLIRWKLKIENWYFTDNIKCKYK